MTDTPPNRCRVRDLDITPGVLHPGALNAVTDVAGVRVGHVTLIEGDDIRTGVTAVIPHAGNVFREKTLAGCAIGNGHGKCTGLTQIIEIGALETPIVLTNTLSVGTAAQALVRWTLDQPGNEDVESVNPVAGECSDRKLNNIRALHITEDDIIRAIDTAEAGPVEEGCVGGGTGTTALGFKGGIGTSSRTLPESLGEWTVGALVQANYGGVLTLDGRRLGERLGRYSFRDDIEGTSPASRNAGVDRDADPDARGGSCMIVLATDAPLSSRQLNRLAARSFLALGRTGSFMSNGSGDIAIAFSTAQRIAHVSDRRTDTIEDVRNDAVSPLFLAAVEAVEESVYNALTMAHTMTGRGGVTIDALPLDQLAP